MRRTLIPRPATRIALPLCALTLLLGCVYPVTVRPPTDPSARLQRIGVMPIDLAPGIRPTIEPDGPEVVGSRVVEALTLWSATPFVPPNVIAHWIEADRESRRPTCRQDAARGCLARALARTFDLDALLYGSLHRYVARQGSAAAASRPAAVWLTLELRTPDDVTLWHGSYDETQKPLSDDLGSLRRASERRFRWVSAETLASYGTRELIQRLDVELRRWK